MTRLALPVLLLLLAACAKKHAPPRSPDAAGAALPDAGRVPREHRAAATACAPDRPVGDADPAKAGCKADPDCTAGPGGRCQRGRGDNTCVYDQCFADADCQEGAVCVCDGGRGSYRNVCLPADCKSDADCAGSYCSPSFAETPQGGCEAPVAFHCHGRGDTCSDDSDCARAPDGTPTETCTWQAAARHWACTSNLYCPRG